MRRGCSFWSAGPFPVKNSWHVDTLLMRVVDALDLLVPKLLLGMGARNSELGNAINDIDRYAEPINLVFNGKLQWRVDVPLLLVTTHMQIVMVVATVGKPVN